MKIYRPIATNKITQRFGENKACIRIYPPIKIIYKTGLLCPTGYTDFYSKSGLIGHNGYDFKAWRGEPVYFPVVGDFGRVDGWTAMNEVDSNGGRGVNVFSPQSGLGEFKKFRFWHLKSSAVDDDQQIKTGQLLGYADSTGASSSDHVHCDMKIVDSEKNSLNTENGYFGAVDFTPDFENRFILDVLGIRPPEFGFWQRLQNYLAMLK